MTTIKERAKDLTKVDRRDGKLALAHIYVAFIALFIGGLCGLLQVLVRSGQFTLPWGIGYYQVLTVHGVLLGLILTTYFILGFQIAAISKTSGTFTNKQRLLGWIGFWRMGGEGGDCGNGLGKRSGNISNRIDHIADIGPGNVKAPADSQVDRRNLVK